MELSLAGVEKGGVIINAIFVCMIVTYIYKGVNTFNTANNAMGAWSKHK